MGTFKSDIEIAQEAAPLHIREVAAKLGLTEDDIEYYGKYKANMFGAHHKARRLSEQFPVELEQCRELGARLVQKAKDAKEGILKRDEMKMIHYSDGGFV